MSVLWQLANFFDCSIPQTLPEAECSCTRAITGSRQFICQPVTITVRVLRLAEDCERLQDLHVSFNRRRTRG